MNEACRVHLTAATLIRVFGADICRCSNRAIVLAHHEWHFIPSPGVHGGVMAEKTGIPLSRSDY